MGTVWVLTEEFNDYDQHGEYFVQVFRDKPTHQQLTTAGVEQRRLNHVLNGGGRKEWEHQWWYLKKQELT